MRQHLRIVMMLLAFGLTQMAWAQERTITGKVTAADDGSPVPGVNVILKGTTTGTVTDFDGNYKLDVPSGDAVLVYRFIGLATQEISIGTQAVIDVSMESEATQLSEIVVTAVGIERQTKALGYSVENVTGDQIQQVSEPDPLRALQGKIPGVNITGSSGAPGSATRITIRGNSSLLGNNQPLFVVDGIPYNNNELRTFNGLADGGAYSSRIADIDPNNIESMTVLKGAAAAALYGSRAANGVVVITTKTGSGSASKKGFEMTFNSSYAMEEIANLPDYQNTYGTGVNFNYQQVNGSWGAPFVGEKDYANTETIDHWYAGRPGMEAYDGVTVPYKAYPNNVRDLFETGSIFENSINITAGSEDAVFTATISSMNNDGYVPNTNFNRLNISAGGKAQLNNGFRVGANLAYTGSDQQGVQSGIGNSGSNNQSAFARALYMGRNWDVQGQPYQNPVDLGSEFMVGRGQADNPYWSYENAGFTSDVTRVAAQIDLGYDIAEWINLDWKFGLNTYTQKMQDFIRPGSTGADGIGRITTDGIVFEEMESNFLVSLMPEINESWSLRAVVGHNINQRTSDRQAYQGSQYVVFDIDDIDNTSAVIPYGGGFTQRRLWGLFADVTLGYNDWAFLTVTGRNDWSSTLPKGGNSFFYPAVTGAVILDEALGITSNSLNFLKLRGSWSKVGNDTNPYQLDPVYFINDFYNTNPRPTSEQPFTPTGGSTIAGASLENTERDPNLLPEQTEEIELGLETKLFNNIIDLDVTVYSRLSSNQIAPVTLPNASGFRSFFTNFGEVSNKGLEAGLGITPFNNPNGFYWNIYGTFTHNRNVIESLTEGVDEIQIGTGSSFAGGVIPVLRPGQEYGILKGSVDDRDQDGNLLIDPGNGQMIRALSPGIIGNPNPDFVAGLTNTFRWKGITVAAVFDWRQGGDLYSNTVLSMLGRGVTRLNGDNREMNQIIPGVYGDPNTHEPIRDENGQKTVNQTMVEVNTLWFGETFAINSANEWNVWDATVFRLREARISYDFPKSLLDSTPFGMLSLSLTGRNLWYSAPNFPKYTNFDPEVNQFGATNKQGIEWSATPSVRRYAVNLRVTF